MKSIMDGQGGKPNSAKHPSPNSATDVGLEEVLALQLVEAASESICLCRNGRITFVNAAGRRLLGGGSENTVIGKPFADFVHDDYNSFAEDLPAFLAEENETLPIKLTPPGGTQIDAEVTATSLTGDGDGAVMVQIHDVTQRVRSAKVLYERERRVRGIVNTVADGVITIDENAVIQYFNPAAGAIFGYRSQEVVGENVKILMPDPHRGKHDKFMRRYKRSGKATVIGIGNRETLGRRRNGNAFPLELAITELRQGTQRLFTGVVRDITERKQAEIALHKDREELELRVEERTRDLAQESNERRRAEEQLRLAATVIETTHDGVVISDADFRVVSVNPAFTEITGFAPEEVIGKKVPFYTAMKQDKKLLKSTELAVEDVGYWQGELWDERKNGGAMALRLSISAITNSGGRIRQFSILISDVTRRKQDEERIRRQANYDALTGLPNRSLFVDRLSQLLPIMRREKKRLGLMFIDLDGFKLVNDTLGHDIGDLLLQEASRRLEKCIRSSDTVARLGGDEFTIIMPNLKHPQNAPMVAQRTLDAPAVPFNLEGKKVFVSASVGITLYPDDAEDVSDLLKYADAAMYRAKEQGKANFQFYTANLNAEANQRRSLMNNLIKAPERNEFSLHYQPKLEIESGRITGVEALLRWQSRDLGPVSPATLIHLMEESGQVVEVGEWIIRTAANQHKAWCEAGLPPISIGVNLSARQLREANFVSMVEQALSEAGIGPEGLEFEITESMLMSEMGDPVNTLDTLHDMGIRIAMDDFGTGYSSLSYLTRFPIDTIKIDQSFVSNLATKSEDVEIIKAIITMGQSLDRRIVAEGVETEAQLSILRDNNCDEIQGYLFSRPLPAEQITGFLRGKKLRR